MLAGAEEQHDGEVGGAGDAEFGGLEVREKARGGGEAGLEVGCGREEHVPGPEHGDAEEEEDGVLDAGEGS